MARVLVVEDENEVAAYFVDTLSMAGYEPERAATAYGAMLRVIHGEYDLVLMDLSLRNSPSTDPLEIRREEGLQSNGILLAMALRWSGFAGKIVVVTGGVMRIDKDMLERAKIDGILLKPLLPRDLIPEVARQLGHGE